MFDAVQLFAKALHELDKSQVVSAILNISRFDIFEQGCLLCHPLSMSFPLTLSFSLSLSISMFLSLSFSLTLFFPLTLSFSMSLPLSFSLVGRPTRFFRSG